MTTTTKRTVRLAALLLCVIGVLSGCAADVTDSTDNPSQTTGSALTSHSTTGTNTSDPTTIDTDATTTTSATVPSVTRSDNLFPSSSVPKTEISSVTIQPEASFGGTSAYNETVSDLYEYFEHNGDLYRVTRVVADRTRLAMPAVWTSGLYLEPPVSARPTYQKGMYLAVDIEVSSVSDNYSEQTGDFLLRFGNSGGYTINMNKALGLQGGGRYRALVDLSAIPAGQPFFGTLLAHYYLTMKVNCYALCTVEKVTNAHTVTFYDAFGAVAATRRVAHGQHALAPAVATLPGYTFIGWDASCKSITADRALYPVYRASGAGNVTVSANGGSVPVPRYSVCRATAQAVPAGQTVQWELTEDGQTAVVGFGTACSFVVTGNSYVKAYTLPDNKAVPAVSLGAPQTAGSGTGVNAQTDLTLPVYAAVPSGCTSVALGVLELPGLALFDGETLTCDTPGVKTHPLSLSGTHAFTQQTTSAPYTAFRAYLTYKNAAGKQNTVYSALRFAGREQEYLTSYIPRAGADTVGTWWWTDGNLAKADRRALLQYCRKNGVTNIYKSFEASSSARYEQEAAFIEAANRMGMQVSALTGDSSFVENVGKNGFDTFFSQYIAYQSWAKKNGRGRFCGIQLDVEPAAPEGLSGAEKDRRIRIWKGYADLVGHVRQVTKQQGEQVEWCTSAWLDGYTKDGRELKKDHVAPNDYEMTMSEWVIQNADTLVLMSYRDTAQLVVDDISAGEIRLINKYPHCKLVLGVETGGEGSGVTFMDDGKTYMYGQLRDIFTKMKAQCHSVSCGVAIHNNVTWYNLPFSKSTAAEVYQQQG